MTAPRRSAKGSAAGVSGEALLRALASGAEALRRQIDAINAINVFPVPDGDTGTNMHSTVRAACDDAQHATGGRPVAVLKAAAAGALMGAKGNSGVILSQVFAGLAGGDDEQDFDGEALADGLERGRAAAYRVVSAPKEGTILTAITAAAEAAASRRDDGIDAALAAAVDAAREAVRRTPDLLPVLKEAGVVDSGAQGLFIFLEGMLSGLRGEALSSHDDGFGAIDDAWLAAMRRLHDQGDRAGFCTEFVVQGDGLDAAAMREQLRGLGESVLVVGGGDAVHVHLHTTAPEDALAYGRSLGTLVREKVDDMEAQFRALASAQDGVPVAVGVAVAVVAVAAGAGIEALFTSMGAIVVHGGASMNPSAGDILRAVEAASAATVIVLPNDKNIVLAAQQAGKGGTADVRVIETRSIPQGVAALVAFNSEAAAGENVDAMTEAAGTVRTAEVTLAARETRIGEVAVRKGQPIGLIDGELAVAAETIDEAAIECVSRILERGGGALVTLYAGDGVSDEGAAALADRIGAELAAEVEVVAGGQPHYPYLIGVE